MGQDSRGFSDGLKKSDLNKRSQPEGCDWSDYYDLDFWLLGDDECHEPLEIPDGKAILTDTVLRQVKDVIAGGGFGDNPEIDEEYKDQTLAFVADALLPIRLGGQVFYQSADMPEEGGTVAAVEVSMPVKSTACRPLGKSRRASKAKSDTKAPPGVRKAGVVTVDELIAGKQAVQQFGGVDRALKVIEADLPP